MFILIPLSLANEIRALKFIEIVKDNYIMNRLKGEIKYIETPMYKIDTEYLGEIPSSFSTMVGVEYFLIVDTYTMGFLGLPNIDPPNNPFRINVNKKKEYLSNLTISEFDPTYAILSPDPDTEVVDTDLMVSLSYFQMSNIDNSKIKVFLNFTRQSMLQHRISWMFT